MGTPYVSFEVVMIKDSFFARGKLDSSHNRIIHKENLHQFRKTTFSKISFYATTNVIV